MNENVRIGIIIALFAVMGVGIWFAFSGGDDPTPEAPQPAQVSQTPEPESPAREQPSAASAPSSPRPESTETTGSAEVPESEDEESPEEEQEGEFTLEVTLVDTRGNPVPDVEIVGERIHWAANEEQPEDHERMYARSDAAGKHTFTNLIQGMYAVRAATSTAGQSETLSLSDRRPEGKITLEMQAGAPMGGIVVNERDEPIEGAVVHLYETEHFPGEILTTTRSTALRVFTDAEGRFHYPSLWMGQWKFYAKADGYAGAITDFHFAGDENIKIELPDGATVSGKVTRAEDDEPLANVPVWLNSAYRRDNFKTETDEDGIYIIGQVREGEYKIVAKDDTYVLEGEPIDVVVSENVDHDNIDLAMTSGSTIRGRVIDPTTDRGLSGIKIYSSHPVAGLERIEITSGKDGEFEMTGLVKGAYRVEPRDVEGVGYEVLSNAARRINVEPGKIYDIDIELELGYAIRGLVVGPDNKPVEDARVYANTNTQGYYYNADARTDAHGRFSLSGFKAGYEINLRADKESMTNEPIPSLMIEDADIGNVKLELVQGGSIEGEVVTASGKPVTGLRIQANPAEGWNRRARSGSISDDGAFTIAGLLEGEYAIRTYESRMGRNRKHNYTDTIAVKSGQSRSGIRIVVEDN